jgi:hypothetical protein
MAGTRPLARIRRGRRPPISARTFALIPNLLATFYLRNIETKIKPTFPQQVNAYSNLDSSRWNLAPVNQILSEISYPQVQKKEPLEVLPPRVHTGVGVRHALFPSDWLFGAWTNLSIHPAFSFGCQFPDAIHRPRFTAQEKFSAS